MRSWKPDLKVSDLATPRSMKKKVDLWNQPGWVDISRPLRQSTPVWPDDRPLEISQKREPGFVLSSFATTCHVGTHVDAPLHVDENACGVEEIPLDRFIGPAEVVRVKKGAESMTVNEMPSHWRPGAPRILLRTDSHPLEAPIGSGFFALTAELVHWLADNGVLTVGIDTPSVDPFFSKELKAHHALIERGMTWIEGMWLEDVEPGAYVLLALPMRLEGTEATPVRALLKRMEY